MKITRRIFLTASAATVGASLTGWRAMAQVKLGNIEVMTLSDGHLTLPGSFMLEHMPEADVSELLARYGLNADQLTPDCNVTLMRDGDNVVLFDVGAGYNFQDSAGQLIDALESAGISPEDVTHVVFTHAHPDHLWGVLDDFDEPVFPNAQYMMGAAEHAYWMDPETVNTIGAARQAFAVGAARYLNAITDHMTLFGDGEEILPGVMAVMTPGHTPGHMSFRVRNGDETLMVIGDCIGNHHVAFERPDWKSGSDQDLAMGAATRSALLAELAESQTAMIGFHFPFPGIGKAEKTDKGYRFLPTG